MEFFDITNTEQFGTALLKGFPVVFGWSGHSCLAVDVLSTKEFKYVNSWKPTWNGDGFGKLAFAKVNFRYGAWAIRSVTVKE